MHAAPLQQADGQGGGGCDADGATVAAPITRCIDEEERATVHPLLPRSLQRQVCGIDLGEQA